MRDRLSIKGFQMALHHTTVQRLAFAKYVFLSAVEQSRAPEVMAAASLLTFHDAIELFLQIASEHVNVGNKQPQFMEYWDLISSELDPEKLPQKESMRRLNKARVALKHNGTLPSKLDIEDFRSAASQFLNESTNLVFGVEFENISLVEYVTPEESRNHLKNAEELCGYGSYDDAATEVTLAFHKMMDNYEENVLEHRLSSLFDFGPSMARFSSLARTIDRTEQREWARFVGAVKESVEPMQRAMKILALGLDYRKYSKFQSLLPYVTRMRSGEYRVQNRAAASKEVDKQYVEFCIRFVVDSAIKLNEFNFDMNES